MSKVINLDDIVIKFLAENSLTLWVSLTMLKGVAKITPFAWDDSIISLLFGAFKAFNPEKRNTEK